MPAEQGGGRDEETRPAGTGKDPTRGRQKRPVSVAQLRAADLPAQNREFVTKHHDLEFLVSLGTEPQHHDREDTPRHDIEEGQDHRRNLRSPDRRSRTYGEVTTIAARDRRRRLLAPTLPTQPNRVLAPHTQRRAVVHPRLRRHGPASGGLSSIRRRPRVAAGAHRLGGRRRDRPSHREPHDAAHGLLATHHHNPSTAGRTRCHRERRGPCDVIATARLVVTWVAAPW